MTGDSDSETTLGMVAAESARSARERRFASKSVTEPTSVHDHEHLFAGRDCELIHQLQPSIAIASRVFERLSVQTDRGTRPSRARMLDAGLGPLRGDIR